MISRNWPRPLSWNWPRLQATLRRIDKQRWKPVPEPDVATLYAFRIGTGLDPDRSPPIPPLSPPALGEKRLAASSASPSRGCAAGGAGRSGGKIEPEGEREYWERVRLEIDRQWFAHQSRYTSARLDRLDLERRSVEGQVPPARNDSFASLLEQHRDEQRARAVENVEAVTKFEIVAEEVRAVSNQSFCKLLRDNLEHEQEEKKAKIIQFWEAQLINDRAQLTSALEACKAIQRLKEPPAPPPLPVVEEKRVGQKDDRKHVAPVEPQDVRQATQMEKLMWRMKLQQALQQLSATIESVQKQAFQLQRLWAEAASHGVGGFVQKLTAQLVRLQAEQRVASQLSTAFPIAHVIRFLLQQSPAWEPVFLESLLAPVEGDSEETRADRTIGVYRLYGAWLHVGRALQWLTEKKQHEPLELHAFLSTAGYALHHTQRAPYEHFLTGVVKDLGNADHHRTPVQVAAVVRLQQLVERHLKAHRPLIQPEGYL